MEESSEDRISLLAESVISHILSRLPTKDAMRTSILSKYWKYKWTSIYNIQFHDQSQSVNRPPSYLTPISREAFRLQHERPTALYPPKILITDVLMCGAVQNLEIDSNEYWGPTYADGIYSCKSLTKLKLSLNCILITSLMKNCFLSLKILYLGYGVKLLNDQISHNSEVVLNFPVLEELELKCYWGSDVKSVEINAPALVRFLLEGPDESLWNVYVIKVNGPKLEKFESCGGVLENVVLTAPSVSNAVLTCSIGGMYYGSRAHAILKGFPALEYLKMSRDMVKALTESKANFSLPCFNKLKQLEFCHNISYGALLKLIQGMPSLESLSLYVYDDDWGCEILKSFPSGVASRLKVVKLVGVEGTRAQIQLAMSVLKNVENLEKLIVSVWYPSFMAIDKMELVLSTSPKSSTHALIQVERSN